VVHFLVATIPFFASWAVYYFFVGEAHLWHPRTGEVLFFTLMISSISLGELVELFYRDRFTNKRLMLAAYFFVCIIVSVFFYAASVYYEASNRGPAEGSQKVLGFSVALALFVFVPGTLLEIVFDRIERQIWRPRLS